MNRGTENKRISNGMIYGIIACVVIAGVAFGLYTFSQSNKTAMPKPTVADSTTVADSAKTKVLEELHHQDSVPSRLPIAWDGDNGPWTAYRIIGHTSDLVDRDLKFGDKVWVDDEQSKEAYKVVLARPDVDHSSQSTFRLNADLLIEEYRFDRYRTNFSLAPFTTLPSGVKKILLDDQYSDGNSYSLTQNEARSKSSVALGDFDEDGIQDVAVIVDNNEKQISRLLIFCSNKVTHQPYVAFAENYTDKMRIRSFREKAKIYLNTSEFVPAPRDGVILTADDVVLAIVYDTESQKFKTYFQE
ncbi:hypothetical protein M8998_03895 [Sphingobacterium sp. lm-10]|uniref:hypothetical protein n=1 Tax=Sphingobacterium sp. lm-10 TaxID=2944904 RepID=UPI002020A60F|nr:hypothetical protein [Sphingobacterium sp. lm-10]MCL7987081.1 hypothetical protein [Sphingobacterium sp. lm-10]